MPHSPKGQPSLLWRGEVRSTQVPMWTRLPDVPPYRFSLSQIRRRVEMKQKIKAFLLSAYGPMAAVVAMYSVKAPVKIWVGHAAGLTAIVADGYHNGSDFLQGLLGMWLIRMIVAAAKREF